MPSRIRARLSASSFTGTGPVSSVIAVVSSWAAAGKADVTPRRAVIHSAAEKTVHSAAAG